MTYDEYCEKDYFIESSWFNFGHYSDSGLKYIYENKPIKREVMEKLNLYKSSNFYKYILK
jgi:hypothetical protein